MSIQGSIGNLLSRYGRSAARAEFLYECRSCGRVYTGEHEECESCPEGSLRLVVHSLGHW